MGSRIWSRRSEIGLLLRRAAYEQTGRPGVVTLSMHQVGRADVHAVLVRLANGDRQAATLLIRLLWPVLLAFARRAVGNADDAEDIAQESLIKIAARVADFDSARDGLSWAFAIASFELKSHRKRVTRRRELADPAALEHQSAGVPW